MTRKFYRLYGRWGQKWPAYFVLNTQRAQYVLRLGHEGQRSFSERHQGTRGIPVTWHYAFGKRLSLKIKRWGEING